MKALKQILCIIIAAAITCVCAVFPAQGADSVTTQTYLYSTEYTKTVNKYSDYKSYKNDSLQFATPGISDGTVGGVKINSGFYRDYIPQGITFDSHTQKLYMSAYSESKQNSVIFVLSKSGKYERTLEIDSYTAHAGGVASDGTRLYFVSGLSIYYVSFEQIATALKKETNTVTIKKSRIAVDSDLCGMSVGDKADSANKFSSCSFCTYFNGLLWFGEFSLDTQNSDYPYRESGESYFFGVDVSSPASPQLKKVMTVPCKTQGATFFKDGSGNVYLACSMSYGRNNSSTMRFYKLNQTEWGSDSGNGQGTQSSTGINKFVHKNNNIKSLTMPNLMEDICTIISGSKAYILSVYESGAQKYASSASYVMDRVSAVDINSCLSIKTSSEEQAFNHSFVKTAELEPSCTEGGYADYSCSICGEEKRETISAKGHDFSLEEENDSTLAENFEQEPEYYYTCKNCGQIDKSSGKTFLRQKNTVYGTLDTENQIKDVLIELVQNGIPIAQKTVSKNSGGTYVFSDVDSGEYTLRYSGRALLTVSINSVNLEGKTAFKVESEEVNSLCAGDANGDEVIDIADISAVLKEGVYAKSAAAGQLEDIDEDGTVGMTDISIILLEKNYSKTSKNI